MKTVIEILFGSGTWGAGGNLVAWVICGIPALVISAWRHRRAMYAELAKVRAEVGRAHQVISDLYELHAGEPHPSSPRSVRERHRADAGDGRPTRQP